MIDVQTVPSGNLISPCTTGSPEAKPDGSTPSHFTVGVICSVSPTFIGMFPPDEDMLRDSKEKLAVVGGVVSAAGSSTIEFIVNDSASHTSNSGAQIVTVKLPLYCSVKVLS